MQGMGRPPSHATKARYAEFRLQERLRLVHMIDFVPGLRPYENAIEVDFRAAGDRARIVVTAHAHLDPEMTRMSVLGFTSQLAKLDRRFGWSAG